MTRTLAIAQARKTCTPMDPIATVEALKLLRLARVNAVHVDAAWEICNSAIRKLDAEMEVYLRPDRFMVEGKVGQ